MSAETLRSVNTVAIRHPHRIFGLTGFAALHAFETKIAPMVDEGPFDREAWEGRVPLEDILLGRDHGLTVEAIELHVMHQPYGMLDKIRPRGWTKQVQLATEKVQADVVGFGIACSVQAPSDGQPVRVRSRTWYAPLGRSRSGRRVVDPRGQGLRRLVDVIDSVQVQPAALATNPRAVIHPDARGLSRISKRQTYRPAL